MDDGDGRRFQPGPVGILIAGIFRTALRGWLTLGGGVRYKAPLERGHRERPRQIEQQLRACGPAPLQELYIGRCLTTICIPTDSR